MLLAITLSACGGGGGGGGGPLPLTIATGALPPAGHNVPYSNALQAVGGSGPYSWTLASGSSLPSGLGLGSDGTLAGTATAVGSYSFSVVVTDSTTASDSASYALDVTPFAASLTLLHWGDAWTGESYPLSSVGGTGTTFTIIQNGSGGSIAGANPNAGTATYVAGPNPGADRIRATSTSGPTHEIAVTVRAHPVAQMKARFANSDVWHCRFDGKRDSSHLYANDFDSALATAGLRGSASFDATGTTADQVARAYVRQQTLRALNTMFGNAGNGQALSGGFAISFPFDAPVAPHFSPDAGEVESARSNQFNVLSFLSGSESGVIGTAYLDSTDNDAQENNTSTSDAGDLGVFVDEITHYFNSSYSNTQLTASPVSSSDVPALEALLYGESSPGGRFAELRRIGEGLGRTLAAVAAHEIGHSVGLTHTSPAQTSSIMNAGAAFGPSETYTFTAGDQTKLAGALPGPDRGGAPQTYGLEDAFGPRGGGALGFEKIQCGACRARARR
jgi:hypothetical protein